MCGSCFESYGMAYSWRNSISVVHMLVSHTKVENFLFPPPPPSASSLPSHNVAGGDLTNATLSHTNGNSTQYYAGQATHYNHHGFLPRRRLPPEEAVYESLCYVTLHPKEVLNTWKGIFWSCLKVPAEESENLGGISGHSKKKKMYLVKYSLFWMVFKSGCPAVVRGYWRERSIIILNCM